MTASADSPLDVQKLRQAIHATIPGELNLHYLQSCDSTNSVCLQQAQHQTVVIAEQQTAGRGRRGNQWYSPRSENIYCSIGLKKTLQGEYLGLISLQVGVCIAQTLSQQGYRDISLKWPNDILVGGQKLGGILIESRPLSRYEFFLAIGFGLNVNLDEADRKLIGQPVTSLQQLSAVAPDRQVLLGLLIARIMQDVMDFDLHRIDELLAQFNRFDRFQGRQVVAKTRTDCISGKYLGLHRTGQVLLETARGVQMFSAADISLREDSGES